MDFPFLSMVTVQDLPTLFAGKLHALLSREYLNGHHWYDFLRYTARGIPVNYAFQRWVIRLQRLTSNGQLWSEAVFLQQVEKIGEVPVTVMIAAERLLPTIPSL